MGLQQFEIYKRVSDLLVFAYVLYSANSRFRHELIPCELPFQGGGQVLRSLCKNVCHRSIPTILSLCVSRTRTSLVHALLQNNNLYGCTHGPPCVQLVGGVYNWGPMCINLFLCVHFGSEVYNDAPMCTFSLCVQFRFNVYTQF